MTENPKREVSTRATTIVQSSQRADFVINNRVYNRRATMINAGVLVPMTNPTAVPVLFWFPSGGGES